MSTLTITDNTEFLEELSRGMPKEDERLIMHSFAGDPFKVDASKWKPIAWKLGTPCKLPHRHNNYISISSFTRSPDSFRRKAETFAAGRAFMVDDVHSKVDPKILTLPPTAKITTSPGNQQWWYMLGEPVRDRTLFGALIKAFIDQRLLGGDPGMSGVTRVGRLPVGRNIKAKYGSGGFEVFGEWEPTRPRFPLEAIAEAFRISLHAIRERSLATEARAADLLRRGVAAATIAEFHAVEAMAERLLIFKAIDYNAGGWREVTCPWIGYHSGKADTGAAIREPAEDNAFVGAFKCWHTTNCSGRGWRDFQAWVIAEHVRVFGENARGFEEVATDDEQD